MYFQILVLYLSFSSLLVANPILNIVIGNLVSNSRDIEISVGFVIFSSLLLLIIDALVLIVGHVILNSIQNIGSHQVQSTRIILAL